MDQDVTEQKEKQKERGKTTNSRVEGQSRGRFGEIRYVGKNEFKGRTRGMSKIDTATNSQSQTWKKKLKTWKVVTWGGLMGVQNIMVGDVDLSSRQPHCSEDKRQD